MLITPALSFEKTGLFLYLIKKMMMKNDLLLLDEIVPFGIFLVFFLAHLACNGDKIMMVDFKHKLISKHTHDKFYIIKHKS